MDTKAAIDWTVNYIRLFDLSPNQRRAALSTLANLLHIYKGQAL